MMSKFDDYIEKYRKIHTNELVPVFNDQTPMTSEASFGSYGPGWNLVKKFAPFLVEFQIKKQRKVTLLDYGSGQASYLDDTSTPPEVVNELLGGLKFNEFAATRFSLIDCYDPAVAKYSTKPVNKKYDIVTNSDVLEHIPEEYIDDVIMDMSSFVDPDGILLLNVSGGPASLFFSNGENLHCTQRPFAWWQEKINRLITNHACMMMYVNDHEIIRTGNYVTNTQRMFIDSQAYTFDRKFYTKYLSRVKKLGIQSITTV